MHSNSRWGYPMVVTIAMNSVAFASLLMAIYIHYSLERGVSLFAVALVRGPAVYGGALYLLRVFSAEDVLLFKQMLRLA